MPEDLRHCSIIDSIPHPIEHKSYIERYFTPRYIINEQKQDIMIQFHSNRIALLTLAPSHEFFKQKGSYKINYSVGKVDRLSNTVSGKGKRGGQQLTPTSIVCQIQFDDGPSFDVQSGMKGTLVEVNQNLIDKPDLLKDFPQSNGYIAIILTTIAASEDYKKELLSQEEYLAKIKSSE